MTIFDEANSNLQINDYDATNPTNTPDCWPTSGCGNPYGVTDADSWSSQHPGGAQFVSVMGQCDLLWKQSASQYLLICAIAVMEMFLLGFELVAALV